VKLIKTQDLTNVKVRGISFTEEPNELLSIKTGPVWVEPAGSGSEHAGQPSSHDPASIEKAAYDSGFRQGEKEGLESAEKKVAALMRRYTDAILEIGRLKPRLYAQVERDVVKLALEVAKKVVHREVHVDREIVQTLIKVALSHVAAKSPVTIRLHPVDYNFVLEQRTASIPSGEGERDISLLADQSIERGGCLIETECGDVDARIEEEFLEVERAFFGGE
jgi:flagellar assembly protein FliH